MPFPDNIIYALMALNPTWFILAFVGICLDLLTGFVIKGVLPHNVQSAVMRRGLVHKSWEVSVMICAALIDVALGVGMGLKAQPMGDVTCIFIFIMEIASVCENALEGNPELANAPVIKYVSSAKKEQQADPDDTSALPRHLGGDD